MRRSVIALASVAVLVGLYALAGYYLVPKMVRRSMATDWTREELGKTLTMGEIAFDPFTLTLDIADAAIAGPTNANGAKPMVAASHLRIDAQASSLFTGTYHLKEFTVEAPYADAVLYPDGTLNLIELMPETDPDEPFPSLRIDRFTIDRGHLDFADHSKTDRPAKALKPISFTLLDFQTDSSDGGQFNFDAKSVRGEALAWRGTASMAPVASKGALTLDDLQMETVAKFFGDYLPVGLDAGSASLALNYDFAIRDGAMDVRADMPEISLSGMEISGRPGMFSGAVGLASVETSLRGIRWQDGGMTAKVPMVAVKDLRVAGPGENAENAAIAVPELRVADIAIDQPASRLTIASLVIAEPSMAVRREADGSISLMKMMPASLPQAAPAPANDNGAAGWTVELGEARVENARLAVEDRAVSPIARFNVAPVNIAARDLGSDMARAASVELNGKLDGRTAFRASGRVTPATLDADIDFQMAGLSIDQLRSYMPAMQGMEVRSALMGAAGKIRVAGGDATKARFKGRMRVDNLAVNDAASGASLVAWRSFALNGMDYAPGRLTIANGLLVEPVGRVEILADGSYNFTGATGSAPLPTGPDGPTGADGPADGDATPADAEPAIAVPPAIAKPEQAGEGVSLVELPASSATGENYRVVDGQIIPQVADFTSGPAPAPAPVTAGGASAMPDMDITLRRLDVRNGTVGFADFSIEPNFQAQIQSLSGSLTNITTSPGQLTQVELEGFVVDRFSPATIAGTMDVFGYDRQTDMNVVFRNIELPVFNPYSGRYAGYAIARGKLTAEFTYHIQNRALEAEHLVIIDQLKWGDPTDSQEKAPFPVRLAASLLKNKDGVIKLDVPVKGTLDDPTFRVGPIIWQIVGNLIEKAITAPFRLLGSLFAGAEDAKFVDFAPGSAELPAASGEAIAALSKAMADREELQLDIPAGPGIREDAVAIADERIDALLLAKEIEDGEVPDLASLSVDKRYDRMKKIYKDRTGAKPEPPDFETGLKDGSIPAPVDGSGEDADELDGSDARKYLETDWMREELRPSFMPTDAELDELGMARARAVRDALLADGTVAPERVFTNTDLAVSAHENLARLELQIK